MTEFGKLCRFWKNSFVVLPRLFLVPGDGRTDGRPAGEPTGPTKTSRKPIQQKAAGSTAQAPELFFLSLSPLVFSRLVPSATDSPESLASLALSLPLARLSTARHAFPTHAHFDGPVVLNLKQRRFGSSFAYSAAAPHPVVSELVSFFLRHPRPYSLVGTLPLLTLPWPIILSNCNALFWPTCSYNFSIHYFHPYIEFIHTVVSSISL